MSTKRRTLLRFQRESRTLSKICFIREQSISEYDSGNEEEEKIKLYYFKAYDIIEYKVYEDNNVRGLQDKE